MRARPKSYRNRFDDPQEAASYDRDEYSPGSYPALLWQLEQEFLLRTATDLRSQVGEIRYMDFACGTGRVLSYMEPLVDHATGIEISRPMLERAAQKVQRASLVQADITSDRSAVTGQFDLITAFRFVLNAEPELRVSALRRLGELLRDERSLLVFNNHINLWSYKLATWPRQRMTPSSRRPPCSGNFLTDRAVRHLADECGLVIDTVFGCGFLSRRALSVLRYPTLERVERRMAANRRLQPLGVDQIYVARRRV